jgi:hypothetical protein
MEWNHGMEWNGMESWNGMEWNGMESWIHGMELDLHNLHGLDKQCQKTAL